MTSSRNPYKEGIDFAQLALQDVDFAKVSVPHLFPIIKA
jgi:hypothetical protein